MYGLGLKISEHYFKSIINQIKLRSFLSVSEFHEYHCGCDDWLTIPKWFPAMNTFGGSGRGDWQSDPAQVYFVQITLASCRSQVAWEEIWTIFDFLLRRELQHLGVWSLDETPPWPLPHQLLCALRPLGKLHQLNCESQSTLNHKIIPRCSWAWWASGLSPARCQGGSLLELPLGWRSLHSLKGLFSVSMFFNVMSMSI